MVSDMETMSNLIASLDVAEREITHAYGQIEGNCARVLIGQLLRDIRSLQSRAETIHGAIIDDGKETTQQ
jgi:hypothetical protein